MAIEVGEYPLARLCSVRPAADIVDYEEWRWREVLVGQIGVLTIIESEKLSPGKKYGHFISFAGYSLKTGVGDVSVEKGMLTLETKNSIYEFEILAYDP